MTKRELMKTLKAAIAGKAPEIWVNLINTGDAGPKVLQTLSDAGYTTEDAGCPQQTWTHAGCLADAEQTAVDAIEAYNQDMTANPDSYFDADDPRRAW